MHYVILGILAIALAVFVIWIAFVLFMRLIGLVVMISAIIGAVALLVGLVWGAILPMIVLRNRESGGPDIASPDAVRRGEVLGKARGHAEHFGWDDAWPNYVPYQLRRDSIAVGGAVAETSLAAIVTLWKFWPSFESGIVAAVSRAVWVLLLGLPTVALAGGIFVSGMLWVALLWIAQQVVTAGQWVASSIMRGLEKRFMRRRGATVHCVSCNGDTTMPSFRCSNAECSRIHRDLGPGPLGITRRTCACGTNLPTTVARASKVLHSICPYCDRELPFGSGGRRVGVVPVFGSVGSGKTQFLATSLVSILRRAATDASAGFKAEPLTATSRDFLDASLAEAHSGSAPKKTPDIEKPEGYTYLITTAGGQFELQLRDAAGERFERAEDSRQLSYFDSSAAIVFIVDPLALPALRDRVAADRRFADVMIAQGDVSNAYGSVVDRLRDAGEDLSKKRIAFVVAKADLVANLVPPHQQLPVDSDGVREWLRAFGGGGLVRRVESDFATVRFFAVNSSVGVAPTSPHHPLHVVDWSLEAGGSSVTRLAEGEPPAVTATPAPATTGNPAAGNPAAGSESGGTHHTYTGVPQ